MNESHYVLRWWHGMHVANKLMVMMMVKTSTTFHYIHTMFIACQQKQVWFHVCRLRKTYEM